MGSAKKQMKTRHHHRVPGRNFAMPHTHSWAREDRRPRSRQDCSGRPGGELKSLESGLALPPPTVAGPRLDPQLSPRTLTLCSYLRRQKSRWLQNAYFSSLFRVSFLAVSTVSVTRYRFSLIVWIDRNEEGSFLFSFLKGVGVGMKVQGLRGPTSQ